MEKINLYFTRSFSNNYHFINAVRHYFQKNQIFIRIVVSHPDKESPTLIAADIAIIEPSYVSADNEDFYKTVCTEHEIDCIIPGESSILSFINPNSFIHKTSIKVLASHNFDIIQTLRSKVKTYEMFICNKIKSLEIPRFQLINDVFNFETGYEEMTQKGLMSCFKPDISQGGSGFRIIDKNYNAKDAIYGYVTVRNTYKYFLEKLKQINSFPPLILLEYLSGSEYSIDCFGKGEQLIFCGIREKSDRKRRIINNETIFEIAKQIQKKFKFSYLYNIQIRAEKGKYYLLEINPRYSAGSYIYELEGLNLLGKAIEMLLFDSSIKPMKIDATLIQNIENYIKL